MKCPSCGKKLPFTSFTMSKISSNTLPLLDSPMDHILIQAVCLECMKPCHRIVCSMTPDK